MLSPWRSLETQHKPRRARPSSRGRRGLCGTSRELRPDTGSGPRTLSWPHPPRRGTSCPWDSRALEFLQWRSSDYSVPGSWSTISPSEVWMTSRSLNKRSPRMVRQSREMHTTTIDFLCLCFELQQSYYLMLKNHERNIQD